MDTVTQNSQSGKETRDTFVMVPRSVLNDKRLTAYDLAAYLRIANVKPDSGGYRTISLDGIANSAQMARSTVQKAVKRLVAFKHVAIDGEKETNRYFLTTPLYGKVPSSLTSRESTKRRFVPPMGTARRYDNHTARRYHIRIENYNKSSKLLNCNLSSVQVTSKELSNSTSSINSNLLPSENLDEAKVEPRKVPVAGKSSHATNFVTQRKINDTATQPEGIEVFPATEVFPDGSSSFALLGNEEYLRKESLPLRSLRLHQLSEPSLLVVCCLIAGYATGRFDGERALSLGPTLVDQSRNEINADPHKGLANFTVEELFDEFNKCTVSLGRVPKTIEEFQDEYYATFF